MLSCIRDRSLDLVDSSSEVPGKFNFCWISIVSKKDVAPHSGHLRVESKRTARISLRPSSQSSLSKLEKACDCERCTAVLEGPSRITSLVLHQNIIRKRVRSDRSERRASFASRYRNRPSPYW